jgi:hypothetical protein
MSTQSSAAPPQPAPLPPRARPVLGLTLVFGLAWLAAQRDFGSAGFWLPWKAYLLALLLLAPAIGRCFRPEARAREPLGSVPVLALLGVIHTLYYALPVLLGDRVVGMLIEPPVDALERALDVCLLGAFGFVLGQSLVPSRAAAGPAPGWDAARARALLFLCLPIGLLAESGLRAGLVPGVFAQPAKLLALLLQVGLGLAILLWRRGELDRKTALPLLGLGLPLFFLASLSEGAIGAAIKGGSFLLALIWATGGRVPITALALAAGLALVLRGGAMEFRSLSEQHPHLVAEGRLERAAMFIQLSVDELERDGGRRSLETITDRLAQVALLGHVVDSTPLAVPYWNGSSYVSLPQSLVPRALWPDKPVKDLGQRFAHRYAIIDPSDRTTSINFPQLIEMYCNFGIPGVFLGMLLFGILVRSLIERLYRAGVGPIATLLGAVWLGGLTSVESDLSLVLGAMLQQAVLIGPLLYWVREQRSERRQQFTIPGLEARA